jgi:carbon-monoxide dehydrogenase iron sulfur subunit
MRKGIIFVDSSKCIGCKRCYQACAVAHSPYQSFFDLVAREGSALSCVAYRPVGRRVIPIECRHCEGAACVVACPSGALSRSDEGAPVILDPGRCIGCRSCVVACPYGAIRTSAVSGKIYKCDLCIERTSAGTGPACAEACPTHCLTYKTVEKLEDAFTAPLEIVAAISQDTRREGE